MYFLFGDTVGRLRRALDTIATTDAHDPENGVRLDFLKSGSEYLTIQPPGISMGAFEVPVAGRFPTKRHERHDRIHRCNPIRLQRSGSLN